jgi:S1-C subfamily serine protease
MKRLPAFFFFALVVASQSAFADYVQLVARAKPCVALIEIETDQDTVRGTGFFISSDGYLVTNEHVIDGAHRNSDVTVTGIDGVNYPVRGLVYANKDDDIAILKVNCINAPYLEIDPDDDLMEGQTILTIGCPKGLTGTVSNGLISSIRKDEGVIQISAPISHGSSGGPVLNEQGMVVGVVVGLFEDGENLNFAIPASKVRVAIAAVQGKNAPARVERMFDHSPRPAIENQEDAEAALNASYQALRNVFDRGSQELLRQEELAWLKQRNRFKDDPVTFFQATVDRVHLLQDSLTRLKNE